MAASQQRHNCCMIIKKQSKKQWIEATNKETIMSARKREKFAIDQYLGQKLNQSVAARSERVTWGSNEEISENRSTKKQPSCRKFFAERKLR